MDSNEALAMIRKVTKIRKDDVEWDVTMATNGPLARLIVAIDDLDRHLSTGGLLPATWEPAWVATADEMSRQESEGLACEVCGRNDLATTVPPRCSRHVAIT